jgi:hypothetical protein
MWQALAKYFKWSNIKRGWKTTVLGSIIILASVASIFLIEGTTWTEATIGIGVGITMLGIADKNKKEDV